MSLLAVPFIVRSIYILLRIATDIDEQFQESIKNDTALAPILSFIIIFIADLVPITSQLSSMLVVVDDRDYNRKNSGYSFKGRSDSEDEYYKSLVDAAKDISNDNTNDLTTFTSRVNNSRQFSQEGAILSNGSGGGYLTAKIRTKSPGASDDSESE